MVFKGLRGSGRPSRSHLGPKVAPKGGQDGQKVPRTGPPEGSGLSFGGLLDDFIAKVAIS